MPETIGYTDIQLATFRDRYAFEGEQFPNQAWRRVANAVALGEVPEKADMWASNFFELLEDNRYVPGGRILAAMGTGAGVTAQNCYVLPLPEDSREGIVGKSLMEWTEIQSKGGGVGINISSLRPRGAMVKGVNGTSSGPVTWAQLFAFVSHDIVIQGGSRRGAAMIMMDVDHPDIFEFIHAKETPGVLEGCNMSVCISDSFMDAVELDRDWDLRWGGKVYETVKARRIWDEIVQAAWRSAEPGIYFMERANKEANSGYFETLISTNPCGEQPLGPYGACLLGSFNLRAFMTEDDRFDFEEFKRYISYAVRFNDNVVDLSNYPLPECEDSQQRIRRMGIGVMGLADVLLDMKIRYGTPEAVEFTARVFRVLRDESYRASALLASERGSFPAFIADEYLRRPFVKRLPAEIKDLIKKHGIRNCYLLTQAPTGTTAQLAGVNGGIEPYFGFKYLRRDRLGEYWVKSEWSDAYDAERAPHLVTAMEVSPEEHVLMQAAAQQYIDASISKTANMPADATVEDVDKLYMLAYRQGLKSLSVYRDGSRSEQVLNLEAPVAPAPPVLVQVPVPGRKKLPSERPAVTHKFTVGEQEGYLTIGMFEDGSPGEVFLRVNKQGSTVSSLMDVVAMLMSYAFQYGVPLEVLTEKLSGLQFEPSGRTDNPKIPFATSSIDYLARWLDKRFGEAALLDIPSATKGKSHGEVCVRCGSMLYRVEGCAECPSCGDSKCG